MREAKLEERYRAMTARAQLEAEDYFARCLRTKVQLAKEAQQMRRAFKRRETELDSLIFQVQAQASQGVRYDCGVQTDMEGLQ